MRGAPASVALLAVLGLAACRSTAAQRPIIPVAHVDLSRYMGRWYVIAAIPTRIERRDFNPVEDYRRMADGSICTVFRFRNGDFASRLHTVHSTATVVTGTGNAEWRVHLFWLLRLQYLVAWLAPDYSEVIVARDARDYLWLMARAPHISRHDYQAMVERVAAMGYEVARLRKSPQQWPEPGGPRPSDAAVCR